MARLKFIDKVLANPNLSKQEKDDALLFEDFLNNLIFIALNEVDEGSYYELRKMEKDYTYLENLLADGLPWNVSNDLQYKILGALSKVYGVDFMVTNDKALLDGGFDLGSHLSNLKDKLLKGEGEMDIHKSYQERNKEVYEEKKDLETDLNATKRLLVGKKVANRKTNRLVTVKNVYFDEDKAEFMVDFVDESGRISTLSLEYFSQTHNAPKEPIAQKNTRGDGWSQA